jgi:ribosomal-protein-alanine N-acetyltransferase
VPRLSRRACIALINGTCYNPSNSRKLAHRPNERAVAKALQLGHRWKFLFDGEAYSVHLATVAPEAWQRFAHAIGLPVAGLQYEQFGENHAMTSKILLRPPARSDESEFLAAVRKSRALHHPWTSPPNSSAKFKAYVEGLISPTAYGFLVCRKDSRDIVGVVNITNIVLGAFRSGYLGYYAFAGHERQGFMREGLQAVTRQAFQVLKLHRLEANIQPTNIASIALVTSCGFSQEGYSPRYLKIGGRWRDHERWTLIAPP